MKPAELIARAHHAASEEIAVALRHKTAAVPWEQLPASARVAGISTFVYLLEQRSITVPPPAPSQDRSLRGPGAMRRVLDLIRKQAVELETAYREGHDSLLEGGGGDVGGGRTSLHDVNPTHDVAMSGYPASPERRATGRMRAREDLRAAAFRIDDALAKLRQATEYLKPYLLSAQELERIDPDAVLTPAELEEARRRRANG